MRLPISEESEKLAKIYRPYLKINEKGHYIPDDAPEEAKEAYKKACDLSRKELVDDEIAFWG
jgi:hypothetical protein